MLLPSSIATSSFSLPCALVCFKFLIFWSFLVKISLFFCLLLLFNVVSLVTVFVVDPHLSNSSFAELTHSHNSLQQKLKFECLFQIIFKFSVRLEAKNDNFWYFSFITLYSLFVWYFSLWCKSCSNWILRKMISSSISLYLLNWASFSFKSWERRFLPKNNFVFSFNQLIVSSLVFS